ncbi:uncharacterized protein F4817DRAFT_327901 [Daldinia loculata]|uniref:uncharacterized protein n=1 Tax=Daldinia loculata TaxID=103429 RepID=UPI0020C3A973|nr:uncharacterized protein F4817DRAFT_327901 [Daldinia loculata]KAI1650492.1 hypothetical protein F4817DRAFT_327901 [Daldinia loculata]
MSILCIAVAGQPPSAQVFPLSLSPQFHLFGGWGSCHHSCVFDTNCSVGQGSEAGESPEEKKICQSRLSVNMIYHYHSIEEEEYAASSLPSYYYAFEIFLGSLINTGRFRGATSTCYVVTRSVRNGSLTKRDRAASFWDGTGCKDWGISYSLGRSPFCVRNRAYRFPISYQMWLTALRGCISLHLCIV